MNRLADKLVAYLCASKSIQEHGGLEVIQNSSKTSLKCIEMPVLQPFEAPWLWEFPAELPCLAIASHCWTSRAARRQNLRGSAIANRSPRRSLLSEEL